MARNRIQPKIKSFLKDLTKICRKHNMIVDANGSGVQGDGKDRGDARFNEGCPLVLYTKSGVSYRKVGYLWYSFVGEEEEIAFNFEPKSGTPYKEVICEESFNGPTKFESNPLKPTKSENTSIQKSDEVVSDTLADAIKKARQWEKENR